MLESIDHIDEWVTEWWPILTEEEQADVLASLVEVENILKPSEYDAYP